MQTPFCTGGDRVMAGTMLLCFAAQGPARTVV
jgi:hypothetical protein